MTPESQRIAIATACGWKNVHTLIVKNVTKKGDDRKVGITSDDGWVPQYLNDLNAMHEAEKVLDEDQHQYDYVGHLVKKDWSEAWSFTDAQKAIHATATQRAEAFLRTLGLWK